VLKKAIWPPISADHANSSSLFPISVNRRSSVATYVLDFFIGLMRFSFWTQKPISKDVPSLSASFWIRAQIVCFMFAPLVVIGIIAVLNYVMTFVSRALGRFQKRARHHVRVA
jgi:hypothetical protein